MTVAVCLCVKVPFCLVWLSFIFAEFYFHKDHVYIIVPFFYTLLYHVIISFVIFMELSGLQIH